MTSPNRPILEPLEPRLLLATFYVAPDGDDDARGTRDDPFRTIAHAARRATAGDTVQIRGGTYRETVRPARSGTASEPITFRAYRDEPVTVSGADVVGRWSTDAAGVSTTDRMRWDLGAGRNQVFVDGQPMTEARWPNTPLGDPSRPTWAAADAAAVTEGGRPRRGAVTADESIAVLSDDALAEFAPGAWDGAAIVMLAGEQWFAQGGTVTASGAGTVTARYAQHTWQETPQPGTRYYLTGKQVALDAPGEWYFDPDARTLHLRTPAGDPAAAHVVEAKRRRHAFDLRGRSHVVVRGVSVFAAGVATSGASTGVRLDRIDARHVAQLRPGEFTRGVEPSGIVLLGRGNRLTNSTIAGSAGDGVFLSGRDHRVEGNTFRDVDTAAGEWAAVRNHHSAGTVVRRNTIANAGRDGIHMSSAARATVARNDVSAYGLQTTDNGGVYTYGTNGRGTEIAYNRFHAARGGGFGTVGVYLDDDSRDYLVHHNLTHDVDVALRLNPVSRDNRVYNNTFLAADVALGSYDERSMPGTTFANNVWNLPPAYGPESRVEAATELVSADGAVFADAGGGDYALRFGAAALDAGVVVPRVKEKFAGTAPDLGAFEFGAAPWVAGA